MDAVMGEKNAAGIVPFMTIGPLGTLCEYGRYSFYTENAETVNCDRTCLSRFRRFIVDLDGRRG
jgi:hypothetical protein